MANDAASLLVDTAVREALSKAWHDSNPGLVGGHEEGGFILRDHSGNYDVSRWPVGGENQIELPPHPWCRIGTKHIVASFHTHPNTGPNYLQEPSETDKLSIRNDPDLKGHQYMGELVISDEQIYLIAPDGSVHVIARTSDILHPY